MGAKINEIVRGLTLRALMVIDIGLLMLAFAFAAIATIYAGSWIDFPAFLATRVSLLSSVLFAIALFIGHGVLVMFDLYQSKRLASKGAEALDVLGAMALLTACLWCEATLFRVPGKTASFLLVFGATGALLIIASRMLLRFVLGGIRRRGRNLHHVVVLGTNPRAVAFARKITAMPDRGCRLLGFVDDDWIGIREFHQSGFLLASSYE